MKEVFTDSILFFYDMFYSVGYGKLSQQWPNSTYVDCGKLIMIY